MRVVNHPIEWYVEKIDRCEPFSICTMGDGEFIAAFNQSVGGQNAEATIYTQELCDGLRETFKYKADNFYFAAPEGLKNAPLSGIGEARIDKFHQDLGVDIEYHEMQVWDDAMKAGNFGWLIKALRGKPLTIISNQHMRLLKFLDYDYFIETGYPNSFDQIPQIIEEVKTKTNGGIYLVMMGLAAPILCQKLHDTMKDSWFLDIGSVWDTFVGIGAQRGFRADLYSDHNRYAAWWRSVIESLCE